MISKETFCKALQMIQEQSETDAEFDMLPLWKTRN